MSKTSEPKFPEPTLTITETTAYGIGIVEPWVAYAVGTPFPQENNYESSSTVYVYETSKEVLETLIELQQENKKLKKELEKYKKIIAKVKNLFTLTKIK